MSFRYNRYGGYIGDSSVITGVNGIFTQEVNRLFGVATPPGQEEFTVPGTYSWTVPGGVTSVCVVCIGGVEAACNMVVAALRCKAAVVVV